MPQLSRRYPMCKNCKKTADCNDVLPTTVVKLVDLGNRLELAAQSAQDARVGLPNGLMFSLLVEIEHGLHKDVKDVWRVVNTLRETGSDAEVIPDDKTTKPTA
jgi:hypothetical protein